MAHTATDQGQAIMYPVTVAGHLVALRELAGADTSALHTVYGDDGATRHLSFEPRTIEQVKQIIKAALSSATAVPRTEYMLAVTSKDGELIGSARLATGEYDSAQIGFALRPDQWDQGKGLETVRLLHRLGFTELGLHRIWGARSPLNQASARTMRAAGMVEEGTIRGHLYTRGAWRDSVVHSILREEFDGQQPLTCHSPRIDLRCTCDAPLIDLRYASLRDQSR